MHWTTELEPRDGVTIVRCRGEALTRHRLAAWEQFGAEVVANVDANFAALAEHLERVAAGKS